VGAYHERAKVEGEVEGVVEAAFMEEEYVGDDLRLRRLAL
jgi:hypothetical protein